MLRLEDLTVEYPGDSGAVRAVDGISLTVGKGEAFALIGESGSGKTTAALSPPRASAAS